MRRFGLLQCKLTIGARFAKFGNCPQSLALPTGTTTLSATATLFRSCQMSGPLTAQSLLRGAVYSLEQCGLLLGDAKLLYENGSYATALAVAAFAREDLGRWRILLKLRKRVLAGEN